MSQIMHLPKVLPPPPNLARSLTKVWPNFGSNLSPKVWSKFAPKFGYALMWMGFGHYQTLVEVWPNFHSCFVHHQTLVEVWPNFHSCFVHCTARFPDQSSDQSLTEPHQLLDRSFDQSLTEFWDSTEWSKHPITGPLILKWPHLMIFHMNRYQWSPRICTEVWSNIVPKFGQSLGCTKSCGNDT